MPLHINEAASDRLLAWLEQVADELLVSDLAAVEVGSAVSRRVRMHEITPEVGTATMADFDRWRATSTAKADILPSDVLAAVYLVREPHPPLLPADAIHLAICQRMGATLVAHDGDMLSIARRMGVACLAP